MNACPSDDTHPFGLAVERRMPKKAANVEGRFTGLHIEPDETVSGMAKSSFEKVLVLREQSDSLEAMQ